MADEPVCTRISSDERRQQLRQAVVAWARSSAVSALAIGVIEGPGGLAPDLFFFAHGGGVGIYISDDSDVGSLPDEHNAWCLRWLDIGAPGVMFYAASSEDGIRQLMMQLLRVDDMDSPSEWRH